MNAPDDKKCIEKILNGNRYVFSILVDRYKDRVYSLALKITNCPEDAEEIAQDAFLKAFRSLAKFKQKSSFATWLYRITYNTAISVVRTKKSNILKIEDFPADSVDFLKESDNELEAEKDYKTALLNFAIQKLRPADRTVISLYYFQEEGIEEIARIMDYTPSNVKVRLHRARKKIEDIILAQTKNKQYNYETVSF